MFQMLFLRSTRSLTVAVASLALRPMTPGGVSWAGTSLLTVERVVGTSNCITLSVWSKSSVLGTPGLSSWILVPGLYLAKSMTIS